MTTVRFSADEIQRALARSYLPRIKVKDLRPELNEVRSYRFFRRFVPKLIATYWAKRFSVSPASSNYAPEVMDAVEEMFGEAIERMLGEYPGLGRFQAVNAVFRVIIGRREEILISRGYRFEDFSAYILKEISDEILEDVGKSPL